MKVGNYVQQPTGYRAFVPEPFPPADFTISNQVQASLELAQLSLGRLDGITELLPDLDFFITMYVRKEATYSSQVEGTRATLADAVLVEAEMRLGTPDDVDDILRHVNALNEGLRLLAEMPLSLRLIRQVHAVLLESGGRATSHAYPGEFRRTQNWIGGGSPTSASFVPPPPDLVLPALSDLERFLYDDETPLLVRAGLAHAQFETIHPFLDGNGRTGRLLVTLLLCERKALRQPVLYLSEYFKRNRDAYFLRLQMYHDQGDVQGWLLFFFDGIRQVSDEAIHTIREIVQLRERHVPLVAAMGKNRDLAMDLLKHLYRVPIVTVRTVETVTGLSRQNANRLVSKFAEAGILRQLNESKDYGRTFIYQDYWNVFSNEVPRGS